MVEWNQLIVMHGFAILAKGGYGHFSCSVQIDRVSIDDDFFSLDGLSVPF